MVEAPTQRLFAALKAAGIVARFVGGCVRNAVLGRDADDLDLAVDKPPELVNSSSSHRSPLVLKCVNDYRNGLRHDLGLLRHIQQQ